MSWLLFMDESGHDHRTMPYEVRGGIALSAKHVWPFVQDMREMEIHAFGALLQNFSKEIKGHKLLDKDRYKWAAQMDLLGNEERHKHCLSFLKKGKQKKPPNKIEFTAYGQACLLLARNVIKLLLKHKATLFASAIPRSVVRPSGKDHEKLLRKDHVFLLERFFYFLEKHKKEGLLILDETDKADDRRFVKLLQDYSSKAEIGRYRSKWIVPLPLFVSSDMSYPVQAADICIYCINWGFRSVSGMNAEIRPEIAKDFSSDLFNLQYQGYKKDNEREIKIYGIVYVPDPYTPRT